jgi:hypothetical protein
VTRNQIWITVGAVAAALALGIAVTLVVTGGDNTDEISTAGTRPTQPPVTTTIKPATTPPPTVAPTTKPPATLPPTTPPTVIVIPPTNAPTSPPTVAPTNPVTVPTSPPTTKPTVPPTTSPPAVDPGITPTEIHLAVIADTQDSVLGVQTWANSVNAKKSGIGGRKIVIDPFVVNGDPGQFAAAVDTACTQDFAIVGSLSAGDSSIGNLVTCAIPDLPARARSSAHAGAPNTYAVVPTKSTQQQVGGFKWLKGAVADCCKQYVISSTNAQAAAATQASVEAANTIGFTSAGGVTLANDAPQPAYTPLVAEMKTKGATFGRSDLPFTSTIALRAEAEDQSLTGVKAWFCLAQCYQPSFLSQGGANVEGQYVQIGTNPFEDAASIPAMKKYLSAGGPRNEAGLESASAGLLFQAAANQVVAAEGKAGLTRAALLQAVAGIDDFNAGGILGLTNVGGRVPNGCFVMMKVDGGKFVRAEPAGAGQLSCGDQNLLVVGP